ncbi:MAG: helix-turn-helix domain-containing protein [Magnetococcales bacterium]|nr:helix-turn-helix domain-containing protein [Magnetococcales bacterium]
MRVFRRKAQMRHKREAAPQEELFAEARSSAMRTGSPRATPPTAQQVGAFLQRVREQQGLSISEMAVRTRIRDVYLFALEAGEVDKLPGATFVAGFLRLYAESLELSDKSLIERYLETSGNDDSLHTELFPAPTTLRHRPSVGMVLGGLIGLLSVFFVYENYFSSLALSSRAPELPTTAPRRAGSLPTGTMESSGVSEPVTGAEDKSGVVTGWLTHFFDRPGTSVGGKGAEETPPLPAEASPAPKVTHPAELAATGTSNVPTGPASPRRSEAVPEKRPAAPVLASPPAAETVQNEPETEEPTRLEALTRQAKDWFKRLTPASVAERQKGETEEEEMPNPPAPLRKSPPKPDRVAVALPVSPAPAAQPLPPQEVKPPANAPTGKGTVPESALRTGVSERITTKPVPPESTSKPVVADVINKPVTLALSSKPGMQETSKPSAPETTSKPVLPDTTGKPVTLALSSKPVIPETPGKPVGPETPGKPVVPETPSKPVGPETPSKPVGPETPSKPVGPETPGKPVVPEAPSKPVVKASSDPMVLIEDRHPESIHSPSDLQPEAEQAISLLANEMVPIQIQDENGRVIKDLIMQPNQLFRVPPGGRFFALLGDAGAVRVRIGKRELPYLGPPGAELGGVELSPEALLRRVKP